MKDLADAMRGIYQDTRLSIENTIPNMNSFITDYYRHMWTDPVKATQAFASRTGSSASLKLRTIPTLAEGILTHGLTPRILDPIENTLSYVHSMQSYLANYTVREIGESIGQVVYSHSGPPVGTNWMKLTGASSNTAKGQAYAPPGWAKVYNSWVGRGVYDWSNPIWGKIYDKMLVASNTMTGLKLGLSGYHAWNIAQETITSGLSKAFGNFEHGELGRGLAELGLTATVAPKIVKNLYRGRELRLAYLQNAGAHPDDVALMNLYARSGGRVVKGPAYQGAGIPNYVKAFQAGSLKFQMKEQLSKLAGAPGETKLATGLLAPGRATEFFANQIGSTFSTIMSPLFDMAIPALKNAAWADEMEMFIRNNPNSTMSELLDHGRPLSNHMDDVFGEMQQDNLYWARGWKQLMNLLTVSWVGSTAPCAPLAPGRGYPQRRWSHPPLPLADRVPHYERCYRQCVSEATNRNQWWFRLADDGRRSTHRWADPVGSLNARGSLGRRRNRCNGRANGCRLPKSHPHSEPPSPLRTTPRAN